MKFKVKVTWDGLGGDKFFERIDSYNGQITWVHIGPVTITIKRK